MSDEPFEEYSFGHAEPSVARPWLAVVGGLIGGAGGYLFARVTQTAYPIVTGGMPIVAPFPTAIVTYELTMLGAVFTTIVTLLITAKLPRWKQSLYDPEVSNGKILIAVVDPADDARAGLEDRCCRCALRSDRPTHPRSRFRARCALTFLAIDS